MVLDENAEALRRSWCLFEVFQTCKLIAERSHYDGLLMCTPAGYRAVWRFGVLCLPDSLPSVS